MKKLRVLYHLGRADFLERTRRYSFLATLGLIVFLGYAVNSGKILIQLDNYRGVYNSAWVGSLMALVVAVLLGLIGFYLVKGSLERDRQTGVGQIMAATPLTRSLYTLGKWLSNLAVLGVMVGILAIAAITMQLVQREVPQFSLWPLLAPLLFLSLPMMALVAAVAVWFETVSWLRGGLGNVLYFFCWTLGLVACEEVVGARWPALDPTGLRLLMDSMGAAARAAFPAYQGGFTLTLVLPSKHLQAFHWAGLNWAPGLILIRLLWVGAAAGIALLAALCFDRFDPTRERPRRGPAARPEPAPEAVAAAPRLEHAALTPMVASRGRMRWPALAAAELRLLIRGQRWWWYAVAAGLIVVPLLTPSEIARQVCLPAAWIWPVLIWSGLGCRETRHDTCQLVFSAPHPLARQLPATWLAGLVVSALAGGGVALRLAMLGDTPGLLAWAAGAAFIPSLALALGVWSGSSKLFEALYVLLWYVGPINRLPPLDYMGATGDGHWLPYLLAALGLTAAAVLGRRRQLDG